MIRLAPVSFMAFKPVISALYSVSLFVALNPRRIAYSILIPFGVVRSNPALLADTVEDPSTCRVQLTPDGSPSFDFGRVNSARKSMSACPFMAVLGW